MDFQIGPYKNKILCDVMPMDFFHIPLGRPWKFDKKVTHDGRSNCHSIEQNGITHVLHPLQEGSTAGQSTPKVLMFSGKEYLHHVEEQELNYVVVCKPRVVMMKTIVADLPEEIQEMLSEFSDIVVDDLPNELLLVLLILPCPIWSYV